MHVTQDSDRQRSLMNTVMIFRVP